MRLHPSVQPPVTFRLLTCSGLERWINVVTVVQNPDLDPQAFTSFMQAYQDMVFSTAARLLGHHAQAEDIAQEVFLKAYQHFAQLRDSETAGGWLKTVTTNLSLNHLSRHRKRWWSFSDLRAHNVDDPADGQTDEPDWPDPTNVLQQLATEERHRLFEQALQQLPDAQRVPLVLYHFETLSYQDIARTLGISLAKVKVDILRGRQALARKLAGVEA